MHNSRLPGAGMRPGWKHLWHYDQDGQCHVKIRGAWFLASVSQDSNRTLQFKPEFQANRAGTNIWPSDYPPVLYQVPTKLWKQQVR